MAEPFLTADDFAGMFRPLSDAETEVAGLLVDVASTWIRDKAPNTAIDDPAAKVVVFEVTRDALLYGKYAVLSSFTQQTGHSVKSGTIDRDEIERFVTDRHRRMLGIPLRAAPVGHFPVCDY